MSCDHPCQPGTVRWFAHGAAGLAKAVAMVDRATEEVIAQRRDVCRICPHSSKSAKRKTAAGLPLVSYCKKCLCPLRGKTAGRKEKCCDGRW